MAKTAHRSPTSKPPADPRSRPGAPTASERRPPVWLAIAGAVVLALVAGAVGWYAGGSGESDLERRAEELRAEFDARDAEQVVELTDDVAELHGSLLTMLEEMAESLPPSGEDVGEPADAATVAGWQETVEEAAAVFEDPPSAGTALNVARHSLGSSIDALGEAVQTYALALEFDADQQPALLERARAQRDLGLRVWSVGATQLDVVNIEAGHGHVHIFLPAYGSGAFGAEPLPPGEGAFDGDPVPDGVEAPPDEHPLEGLEPHDD